MKKLVYIGLAIAALGFGSCDKVTNAYPKGNGNPSGGLDWSLYPDGDSANYAQNHWPTWTENTNTLRNVMIEDFTGHQCPNCPTATANMETLIETNPARIFGVGIHASPTGLGPFQETNNGYNNVLYCDEGLTIGQYFGSIPGTAFQGNPSFCVNRVKANDQYNSNAGSAIANKTNSCLASALQVNIQAKVNYFASTRGVFLHTEVDKIDQNITSDLGIVVYLIEDSLVGKQSFVGTYQDDYVHHDILRGCIDGSAWGKTLTPSLLGTNGNYYVNYSYALPAQYAPENMHVLVYVYDKTTLEIYQVIKEHLLP